MNVYHSNEQIPNILLFIHQNLHIPELTAHIPRAQLFKIEIYLYA